MESNMVDGGLCVVDGRWSLVDGWWWIGDCRCEGGDTSSNPQLTIHHQQSPIPNHPVRDFRKRRAVSPDNKTVSHTPNAISVAVSMTRLWT
jgi:hypothetical protein